MLRTLKTKPQEQNEAEIDLAYRTMELLGKLYARSHLKPNSDLRSIVACLCDWQDRWATPILNPMTGKPDFEGPLETPRPLDVLITHRYLVRSEGDAKDASDVVTHEKKRYCYAGKATWSAMVKAGKLTGADAEAPKVTAFCWLKDFFQLIAESNLTAEEKAELRPLAACWYYSATECNFDESEEEPAEDPSALQIPPGLMNMLMAGAGLRQQLEALGNENDEDDEDFDPEGDDGDEEEEEVDDEEEESTPPKHKSLYMRMKAKTKHIEAEEEEDSEDEQESKPKSLYMRLKSKNNKADTPAHRSSSSGGPAKKSKSSPGKKVTFSAPEEEDAEEEEEEEEDVDAEEADDGEEDDPLARPPETEQAKEIREAILKAVGDLNSYMPLPSSHMLYFKRMLVRMQERDPVSQLWFPWGQPPIQHLLKVHASAANDPGLKRYTEDLLGLIAPQMLKQ